MPWVSLMPSECEVFLRPVVGEGANAALLRGLQGKVDRHDEIELTATELRMVKDAVKHWRGGGERQFRALLTAADRHGWEERLSPTGRSIRHRGYNTAAKQVRL